MNQSDLSGLLCVGTHEMVGGEESYAADCSKMNQDTSHETTKFDVVMATSAVYTDHRNTNACFDEYHMSGIQPSEEIRFGSTQHFELPSQEYGMVADSEEESMSSSPETSSNTNCDKPGYMDQDLQHVYRAYDAVVEKEGPVILEPDFIMCNETLHLGPHLTFSSDGIKIEYLDLDSTIDLHWEISNIISISCKWAQSVGFAFITLLAGSEAEIRNSGLVRVQFSLDDLQWPKKQQNIWYLGARYQEIWEDIPSDDFTLENWSIESSLFFPRHYFSSTEDFEDIIYPKGDPDAVSISKRDAELLLPETFVNDTIIDFYIKYLSTRIESTEKRRYHFFNSFFFRKLADLDKDQGRAPEGRAAFLRVRKWTRKISIFEKDFLFIPVNFNLHWSLIVICYPGEVATFGDGEAKVSAKLPCILHMDSLKGSHSGLKDIIQGYLWEEWKERHPESASDNSDKFLNLRFVSLELPQQDNSFDCGLFLLHYVELFLMDAPSNFNPLKIDEFSGFLGDDWFPPAEASLKRSVIQKLIHELVTGSFQNYPKLAYHNKQPDERHQRNENAEREPAVEFPAQRCSAGQSELVCTDSTVPDDTHGTQPSTSICLNDFKENELPASEAIVNTGGDSMVAVQNLQESGVCSPGYDTVVCLSSQDEKNDIHLAESHNQLDMRSCAPEDAEVLKGLGCVVTEKDQEESLLVSLDDKLENSSQTEVEVQDIMISRQAKVEVQSISFNTDEVIVCQEHALQRNTNADGDECHRPSQDMDSVMMLDSSKDDIGPNPERTMGDGDGSDLFECMDSVTPGDIKKDVADTKREDNHADPVSVENAIDDSVKENKTADNVNHSEAYVSSELTEGNSDSGVARDILKLGNTDNGMTCDTTVSSCLNEASTDNGMGGDISELKLGNTGNGGIWDTTVSTELNEANTDNDISELKLGNTDNGITCNTSVSSDLNEGNTDNGMAGDISELKLGNTDNGISCDTTVSSDLNEGNTDRKMVGDYTNDTTCIDAEMPLIDRPCSEKNETENTTSDAICEEKDSEKRIGIQSVDAHGTDAKIERHYKRRKVLAAELEKQRSSSASSLD